MQRRDPAGLVRGLRRWDLLALVLNVIIGAGIFGLPSIVYKLAGSYSVLAYLACGLLITLILLCFAEVSSRFEGTGGPYLYACTAFGSVIGFEMGWLLWLTRVTSFAALCNLFINYLGYFWPDVGFGTPRVLVITAIVGLFTFLNLVGVRAATLVNNVFTFGKLVPLILLAAVGVLFIDPQRYTIGPEATHQSFSTAILLLVYAFSGFEVAVIPAGEALNPKRNLPFALLIGIAIVTLLYVLIQVVCIGTLPGLAESNRPLSEAGGRVFGAAGSLIISVAALISIAGSMNATVLACPRLLYAMAEQGHLPGVFLATHLRYRTPYLAILLSGTVMLLLTVLGSFLSTLTVSTIIRLMTYGITCVALVVLRHKSNAPPASFRVPAGNMMCIAALALCAWLLTNITWREIRVVGIALVLGILFYCALKLQKDCRTKQFEKFR